MTQSVLHLSDLRNEDPLQTFNELPLNAALQRAIADLGYTQPSPIQAQALPILLGEPTDFIGLAATGTGKTAAFSMPMLERLDPKIRGVQALILCPTRELSNQVAGQVNLLGKYLGIQALAIYGGAGYDEQLRGLKRGMPVVVGTPGRIIDHLERGTLKLDQVRVVVLDEADEMISMGFREEMETILEKVPPGQANTWLFSATMSGPVRKVADRFLTSPQMVQVNRTEMLSAGVEQIYYLTHEKNKPEVLCKLVDAADDFYGVVFAQTKSLVVDLTRYLTERGYRTDSLHGDMSQTAREAAMLAFRERRVKILVCTDVASRGLDVKDITHVVNYSLPRELDSYVHRIGRTARSGKTGIAMSLVTPSHRHLLQKIERMTKSRFTEGQIPNRRTIAMKKIGLMLEPFASNPNYQRAIELMDESWKQAVAEMAPEEVAARFLAMMFPFVFADKEKSLGMARSDRPATPASQTAAYGDRREPRAERREREGERGKERRFERRGYEERPERREREARPERYDRRERPERSERRERPERPERYETRERSERPAPYERRERPRLERPEWTERKDDRPARAQSRGGEYPPRRANDSKEARRVDKRLTKRDAGKKFKRFVAVTPGPDSKFKQGLSKHHD